MRKSSKSDVTFGYYECINGQAESGGWCDLRMKRLMEWTFEGGPKFIYREQAPTGTEPVTNQECMFVHEKVDDLSI